MHLIVTALMTPFRPGASPPPVRIPTLFTSATLRPPPGLLRGASLANRPPTGRAPRAGGKVPGPVGKRPDAAGRWSALTCPSTRLTGEERRIPMTKTRSGTKGPGALGAALVLAVGGFGAGVGAGGGGGGGPRGGGGGD